MSMINTAAASSPEIVEVRAQLSTENKIAGLENSIQTNNAGILAANQPSPAESSLGERLTTLENNIRTNNGEFYAAIMLLLDLQARTSGDESVARTLELVKGIPGRTFPGCRASDATTEKVAEALGSQSLKYHWYELKNNW